MKMLRWVVAPLMVAALAACGGGGGSAGTQVVGSGTDTGTGTGTGSVTSSAMSLQLVDSTGAVLASPTLSQTEARNLKVTLKNAAGAVQAFKRVAVTLDSPLAVLTPQSGTQLTDAAGVAVFAIAPASVTSSGAVTATAKASVDGVEAEKTLDLQITAGNVALSGLSVNPASVQLGQSVNVSVNASVNGQPAASNSVTVAITSTCGTVSPASSQVDSSGKASAVIQTTVSGSCSVAATTAGIASPATASYTVTTAPVTGIQFVQVSPSVIYQQDSVGANSSIVKFKVIDSNGNPVSGQTVNAALINPTGGVHFCDAAAVAGSAVSAAPSGEVSFSVCSGTQPETVQVRATLAGVSGIFTDSNILTVQTGLPTQRFFDIAASSLNLYCGGYFTSKVNNDFTTITVNLADRQGNPVPNGTPVALVTEGGQINSSNISSCIVNNGSCSVPLICQDYRPLGSMNVDGTKLGDPRPGRVTVLAMADGEESFVDKNNNNRYDPGELFEDLGVPFMDKNEDGALTVTYKNRIINTDEGEVSYPIAVEAKGSAACPENSNVWLSQPGTCNSTWNGSGTNPDGSRYTPTKVRRDIVIIFSGGEIGLPNSQSTDFPACTHSVAPEIKDATGKVIGYSGGFDASIPGRHHTQLMACSNTGMQVRLADRDGNPLPADATLGVSVRKPDTSNCTAKLLDSVIGNSTEPTMHGAILEKCAGGETIEFTVVATSGTASKTSMFTVTVPAP